MQVFLMFFEKTAGFAGFWAQDEPARSANLSPAIRRGAGPIARETGNNRRYA
jgi:hypothetical protein